MIQFGGETLFVCLDGTWKEQPAQEPKGLPVCTRLGHDNGEVGTFDLYTVKVREVEVHLYVEVSRGRLTEIERKDELTLQFPDGSTLSGPQLHPTEDGSVAAFYSWDGGVDDDGGQAKIWAEKWARHPEGIDGDGGEQTH